MNPARVRGMRTLTVALAAALTVLAPSTARADTVEVTKDALAPPSSVASSTAPLVVSTDSTIPYPTTYVSTATLYKGRSLLSRAGVPGLLRTTTVDSLVVSKQVVKAPVSRVILAGTYVAPSWLQPVGTDGSKTDAFGMRLHPIYRTYRMHWGWDIGHRCGAPVRAARAGVVTVSTYHSSSGRYVQINHGRWGSTARVDTRYLHLSSSLVKPGQRVSIGQVIGYEGMTGSANVCHVHFETLANGTRVDPTRFLGDVKKLKASSPTILAWR